ncbi:unnamed protein product [Leptidea sinapis]|uniref:Transforming acidic coiled-coil-containing protein C-terminal domain-containing protein n=1 Tax=Leptidea sinapis TaxID=189913 RepID=A0A5E4PUJ6_9NEOP|nr:unnamed protein product [Leptidea sinapis]
MGEVVHMDLDIIKDCFDDKENTFQNTSHPILTKVEKIHDISNISDNHVGPKGSAIKNDQGVNINQNLSKSSNLLLPEESLLKSCKSLPLQTLASEKFGCMNRQLTARQSSLDIVQRNNATLTTSTTDMIEDNHALPLKTIPLAHTLDNKLYSRGLKNNLTAIRLSETSLAAFESASKQDLSINLDMTRLAKDVASTKNLNHDSLSNQISKNLDTEVQLEEDKLFNFAISSALNNSNSCVEDVNQDSTLEYMDISFNVSVKSIIKDQKQSSTIDENNLTESDSEFQDCETTLNKSGYLSILNTETQELVDKDNCMIDNKMNIIFQDQLIQSNKFEIKEPMGNENSICKNLSMNLSNDKKNTNSQIKNIILDHMNIHSHINASNSSEESNMISISKESGASQINENRAEIVFPIHVANNVGSVNVIKSIEKIKDDTVKPPYLLVSDDNQANPNFIQNTLIINSSPTDKKSECAAAKVSNSSEVLNKVCVHMTTVTEEIDNHQREEITLFDHSLATESNSINATKPSVIQNTALVCPLKVQETRKIKSSNEKNDTIVKETQSNIREVSNECDGTIITETANSCNNVIDNIQNINLIDFENLPINDVKNNNGEIFIDAETFELFLNKNIKNVVIDSGKESLFLKFDPLFAQRLSLVSQNKDLGKDFFQKNNSHVGDNNVPQGLNNLASCSVNRELSDCVSEEYTNVVNTCKPIMAVSPTPNSVAAIKSTKLTRDNRQLITLSSPAMAAIEQMLSYNGNSHTSLLDQDITIHNINPLQICLREMLARKETDVNRIQSQNEDLKDRLIEAEYQVKFLKHKSEETLRDYANINERVKKKTEMNKKIAAVLEEYERKIESLVSNLDHYRKCNSDERAKLLRECDEQAGHVSSIEYSYNDLFCKYKKNKQIILSLKLNEDEYKKTFENIDERVLEMQTNYKLLKQNTTVKLNDANEEYEKMMKVHEAEKESHDTKQHLYHTKGVRLAIEI